MRPVYIVCAESGTQDKDTNLVSLFNIIEKVTFSASKGMGEQPRGLILGTSRFHVVAVWMKEDGDDDKLFESDIVVEAPGRDQMILPGTTFSIGKDKFLQRMRFLYEGPPFFKEPGFLRFVSRVREIGTEGWKSQDYPLLVEVSGEFGDVPIATLLPGESDIEVKEAKAEPIGSRTRAPQTG